MARFAWLFGALLLGLLAAELTPPVQRVLVQPWTGLVASGSAMLIRTFDPQVVAVANMLQSTRNGFAVSIQAGCNGIEATIVLVSAMVAFPASWKHRLAGIAIGFAAVQALNVVRVVSLFYLGQWSTPAFEWAHLYLWQALIMLDVLAVTLVWMRLSPRPE